MIQEMSTSLGQSIPPKCWRIGKLGRNPNGETTREQVKSYSLQLSATERCRGPWAWNFPAWLENNRSLLYSAQLEKRGITQPYGMMHAVPANSFLLQNVISVGLGQI